MSKKTIAAIDVGSHALRMTIGEINRSGNFKELESFRKIVPLGHDTFTKGKVTFDSVEKVCEQLKLYKKLFADYGVQEYLAMATSAIREAKNRDFIIDQIKIKTGLDVKIISNEREQFLVHKALKRELVNYETYVLEGAVVVVIGAGGLQVTTYKNGELKFSQSVKMGALRIKEAFDVLENNILNYTEVLDEYITTTLSTVEFFKNGDNYKHLIAVGGEMSMINKILEVKSDEEVRTITKKQFYKLGEEVEKSTVDEIIEKYNIKKERAEILLPSMILFKKFLEEVESNIIITPKINLANGIIDEIYDRTIVKKTIDMDEDIISNARFLAQKFGYNEKHSKKVEETSLVLFDRLKKIHGLKEERLILQVACMLQNIGKIISLDDHYQHSYELISALKVFGLHKREMQIIANIALYQEHRISYDSENFLKLTGNERAIVGKLAAIIRISEALDSGHKQKLTVKTIKTKDKELIINCVTNVNIDTTLEEMMFKNKAEFFKEVFGIKPILKIRREFV